MKKVKFTKAINGTCVCLDNSLFLNENDKIETIIKIFEVFSFIIEKYEGNVFVSKKDESSFTLELNKINCSYDIISTHSVLFSKYKESELKITFDNNHISNIINLILKYELTFSGYGFNHSKSLLIIVINDHDGSYITFNNKIFEKEKYKQLIYNLFK